jgi:DNA replication protein DnaC
LRVGPFIIVRRYSYERRSLLITANQPFGAWDAIFPDPAMTVAAIDRLVHHSIIGSCYAKVRKTTWAVVVVLTQGFALQASRCVP